MKHGLGLIVALGLALTGCNAAKQAAQPTPAQQPFPFDTMAGTWTGTATVTNPEGPASQSQMNMTVTFNNSTVTTIFSANPQFQGTCQANLAETSADYNSTSSPSVGYNVEWYGSSSGFPWFVHGNYTPSTNTITGIFSLQSQIGCDIYDGTVNGNPSYVDVLTGTLTITKQ